MRVLASQLHECFLVDRHSFTLSAMFLHPERYLLSLLPSTPRITLGQIYVSPPAFCVDNRRTVFHIHATQLCQAQRTLLHGRLLLRAHQAKHKPGQQVSRLTLSRPMVNSTSIVFRSVIPILPHRGMFSKCVGNRFTLPTGQEGSKKAPKRLLFF